MNRHVSNCAQLLVFVKYIKGGLFKEEFLFCESLESTTKGEDIFEKVSNFFQTEGLLWKNVYGSTSDGAPAMLGCRSGFLTRIRQLNPNIKILHCMIYRHALASRTMPQELMHIVGDVVKMVNFIKSSTLNTRIFKLLCQEFDSEYETVLFHTEVRWLSKGNVISRFRRLQIKLKEFFSRDKRAISKDFLGILSNEGWLLKLAYLYGIFTRINMLNKSLQGRDATVIDFVDKLRAFLMKLELWETKVKDVNMDMFETLSEVFINTAADTEMKENILNLVEVHLCSLRNEMKLYFSDVNDLDTKFIRNPFNTHVLSLPDSLQEEFLDFVNDSTARETFDSNSLISFWCKIVDSYKRIAASVVKILLLFPSTYLCKSGFSSMLSIKTKYRYRLNVEDDLRSAISTTVPRFEKLVNNKQYQPLH